MLIHSRFSLCFLLLLWTSALLSQNETNKWYFGNYAGLDFMTNPPTVLTNGSLTTIEGCATISDAAGNLLFYTDGIKVFDKTHAVMANGTTLNGNNSSSQSAIIAKQPGNANIYYIFTQSGPTGAGAAFSIVDMSLAAGMGSVTVKNTTLSPLCTEKLTSVKHCNGTDIWVIYHDWNSADFKSFLLTSAGVNTTAVVSSIGSAHTAGSNYAGCMKTSPNGKKLAVAIYGLGVFELFDFDNTTGVVSNSLNLTPTAIAAAYGCEFSPDGTKLYGSRGNGNGCKLYQWDLCAGSPTAIVASAYSVAPTGTIGIGALQRASDGKIYGALSQKTVLIVVNDPNQYGAACNYVEQGLSIAPKSSYWSMPNFITSFTRPPAGPFTYSVNCSTTSFSLPASVPGSSGAACQSASYSLTNVSWDFGDPLSGNTNTSTTNTPSHIFSAPGTYTTELILYYSCGGGTDTLRQAVTISQAAPSLSISGTFTVCSGEKRIYTASGAGSYTWSTGSTAPSITVTTSSSFTYTVTGTGTNTCSSQKTFSVTVNKCTGISEADAAAPSPVHLYPNPVNNYLQIETTEKVQLLLFDLEGRLILKKEFEPGLQQLDLSHFQNGVYSIRTVTAGESSTRRLVKLSE